MNKDITNHPSALDINEIWTAIEPQVDQINAQRKKRKPVFLYWLSGFGLLIGLVTLGFFLGNPIQNSVTPNQELPKQTSQTAAPIVANELDNTIINEKTNTSILAEVEPTNSVSVNGNEKNSFDSNINIVKKNPIVVSPTSPTVTISNSTSTKNTLSGFPKTTLNSQTLAITQPKKAVSQSSAILGLKSAMTSLAKLPIATVGLKDPETDLPELNFSIKNNKSQLPLPLYVEHPTFSIEFQTGISATNRSLSSTGDSQQQGLDTLLSLRNTFEKSLETLHANLLVNAHFPSGFYVSSGVAFTQISELYSNNSEQITTVIDPMGIQKRVVINPGDTIDIIGPVESTVTTSFSKKYYNTYRMIDIPFFVGYQYDFGDWKTDFSLGVFANILLATKGRIPNSPITDLDLSTNGKDIYRSRVDYSLQFGIGVSKSLTEKLSIRVNPMFRYYSKNFIKENYGLSQRYLLFGGTIGLRIDL